MRGFNCYGMVVAIVMCLLIPGSSLWAAESPPASGTIQGPEVWGEVVLDETNQRATLRVKLVKDCDVYTDAHIFENLALPGDPIDDATDPLYFQWSGLDLFESLGNPFTGIPVGGTPIITKVKNFTRVTSYAIPGSNPAAQTILISFDCQIKFWMP